MAAIHHFKRCDNLREFSFQFDEYNDSMIEGRTDFRWRYSYQFLVNSVLHRNLQFPGDKDFLGHEPKNRRFVRHHSKEVATETGYLQLHRLRGRLRYMTVY